MSRGLTAVSPSATVQAVLPIRRRKKRGTMPKYLIERDIPGIGNAPSDQFHAIAQKSCSVLHHLGPDIQWLHSYVTTDRIYCLYIAPGEELLRRHAADGGFPANRISEVRRMIDPVSAEA